MDQETYEENAVGVGLVDPDGDGQGHDGDMIEPGDQSGDESLLSQIARDTATTKTLTALLLAVVIVGVGVLGILVVNRTGTAKTVTAAVTTTADPTSSAPAAESAAGKPCVATVDPLPPGAPAVDVAVGAAPTSLVVKDIKEGTGATVGATDTVTINYIGVACSTGKIFDSSYTTGTPGTFAVDQVIPGVGQGVTGMKVGGQRLIGIPSDQAYGPTGSPPAIAPDEALWFVIEVTADTPA